MEESFQRLDDGVDLEDVPLTGFVGTDKQSDSRKCLVHFVAFMVAAIATVIMNVVCDEATTYLAWCIIVGFVGLICEIIACLGDTNKMKTAAYTIGSLALMTSFLSFISLYVSLLPRKA